MSPGGSGSNLSITCLQHSAENQLWSRAALRAHEADEMALPGFGLALIPDLGSWPRRQETPRALRAAFAEAASRYLLLTGELSTTYLYENELDCTAQCERHGKCYGLLQRSMSRY